MVFHFIDMRPPLTMITQGVILQWTELLYHHHLPHRRPDWVINIHLSVHQTIQIMKTSLEIFSPTRI